MFHTHGPNLLLVLPMLVGAAGMITTKKREHFFLLVEERDASRRGQKLVTSTLYSK